MRQIACIAAVVAALSLAACGGGSSESPQVEPAEPTQAEKEAAEQAAREKAQREAEQAAREQAERERLVQEEAERQERERLAREEAERAAARLPFPLPEVECDWLCQATNGDSVADEHHGIAAPTALSVQHLPVYLSGRYLRVGVDQGRDMGSLSIVGTRADMDIRYGSIVDGEGQAIVQAYLDDAAGARYHGEPPLVRMVGSLDSRQQSWVKAAVRAVNAALPPDARMRLGPALPADYNSLNDDGTIAIKFVPAGSFGGNVAARTPSRVSRSATGEITGAASNILLDRGAAVFTPGDLGGDRRAVILIAHEILHALGLSHVSPAFDTIIANNRDMYRLRQGRQQPASLLYPADREALRVLYEGHDPTDFGPWSARSTHLHGNGAHAAFGIALRNGYAEPYAYGLSPSGSLANNPALSGTAEWIGTMLGFTPAAEAVAGEAAIGVNLGTMAGRADFTSLETWTAEAAPGEAGTGAMWLDGDLGYIIAVHGNTFRETGGDDGRLTGIFTGQSHEGAAGTLERSDLTAAFGASR